MMKTRAATLLFRDQFSVALVLMAIVMSITHRCLAIDDPDADQSPQNHVRLVDPSRRIEFRMSDGVRITGTLTKWDNHSIDGSFGRRAWSDIRAEDAWNLYAALADRDRAADWVNLGRIMLIVGEDDRAEHAFRRARTIDPTVAADIVLARRAVEEELKRRAEAQRLAEEAKLRTISPEAGPWKSEPWPILSAQDRANAATAVKARAEAILTNAGMTITPVETDLIVLYSDAPRAEAALWVIRLERAYKRLARLFEIHSSQNVFHGKAIVFVFTDHDRYRLVEAEAFKQLVPRGAIGLCHFDGPDVYLCFHQHEDPDRQLWELIHQFTHAFMHRMVSPARLPAWANEGLAHVIASEEMAGTLLEKDRRAQGLDFIRSGASTFDLLNRTYEQFEWTDVWTRFTDVSGLIMELMLRDRPQPFRQFVHAVKRGKDWREAMTENFGVDAREVIDTAVRHYMVND